MKLHLLFFALLIVPSCMAETGSAQTKATDPADDYPAFITKMTTPENLTDCIAKMDELIDAGERPDASPQNTPNVVALDTKNGFHMEFSVASSHQAIIYYFVFSRKGQELKFSDAAKMIALFGDRAGLPHPIIITEAEKPIFYAQWLIKPSDWTAMRKMMLKVRAENRSEKDPQKAFVTAVLRELDARQAAQRKAESN